MPTVVLNLTQKSLAFICPLRQTLPPERSLRSAHRLSESSASQDRSAVNCPPSSRSHAARSCQRKCDLGRANKTNSMSCYMMAARKALLVLKGFSFLFFTGRGDSFLSQRRERKERGRKNTGWPLVATTGDERRSSAVE